MHIATTKARGPLPTSSMNHNAQICYKSMQRALNSGHLPVVIQCATPPLYGDLHLEAATAAGDVCMQASGSCHALCPHLRRNAGCITVRMDLSSGHAYRQAGKQAGGRAGAAQPLPPLGALHISTFVFFSVCSDTCSSSSIRRASETCQMVGVQAVDHQARRRWMPQHGSHPGKCHTLPAAQAWLLTTVLVEKH